MKTFFLIVLVNSLAVFVITAIGCFSQHPISTNIAVFTLFVWFNIKMLQCN